MADLKTQLMKVFTSGNTYNVLTLLKALIDEMEGITFATPENIQELSDKIDGLDTRVTTVEDLVNIIYWELSSSPDVEEIEKASKCYIIKRSGKYYIKARRTYNGTYFVNEYQNVFIGARNIYLDYFTIREDTWAISDIGNSTPTIDRHIYKHSISARFQGSPVFIYIYDKKSTAYANLGTSLPNDYLFVGILSTDGHNSYPAYFHRYNGAAKLVYTNYSGTTVVMGVETGELTDFVDTVTEYI